jgi:hypothetical protein
MNIFRVYHIRIIAPQKMVHTTWNRQIPQYSLSGMCACLPQHPWLFIFSSQGQRVQILGHTHIICITVRENRIFCCQIFCDLLLKSAFEWIFNVMQLILVKQTDSSIIIVRNVCVLTQHSWLFIFSSRGHDRQSSEQNNRKLIRLHNNGNDNKHAHRFADF